LETRFEVASKKAGLGLEERNVQLLALVYVSDGALRVYGGSASVVVTRSGQRYDNGKRSSGGHILFCPRGFCLLEGREVRVLSGYDCFWIWIACAVVVSLAGVRFCERLVVS
jgi:hypothetical protein